MLYERYLSAETDINEGLIRVGLSLERENCSPKDPNARMNEMRRFLDRCGNPQQGIPAVHVGGTSGKGSVAAGVAGILTQAGFKVGLHVSPYLQSATEKIWIGDRYVGPEEFADLVAWIMPIAKPLVHPDTRASIHGMASVAIAFEAFRRNRVDLMVFEVGCGGRFDLTSFVDTKVAVVTNVGLDHVVSLGPTLTQIAWHKAGIARAGVPLFTGATGEPLDVIRAECEELGAPLFAVPPQGSPLEHNRQIARVAAIEMAHQLDMVIDDNTIEEGLSRVKMPGRCEWMPRNGGPRVMLDGAHNEHKLAVAVNEAQSLQLEGKKVALIGFLGTKAKPELVAPLRGRFDVVIATEPQVYAKTPCPVGQTAALLRDVGFDPIEEPNPMVALKLAEQTAGNDGMVLATGSFYLVGDLRERWFPKERVVCDCQSWPALGSTVAK